MAVYRFAEAARLLGVSDDTVRRWADAGRVPTTKTGTGASGIDGHDLARLAQRLAETPAAPDEVQHSSARNRLTGIVTDVTRDKVMAQVEMCCGPYRIVSLLSREAADELGLEVGVMAVASVKATNVVVELP
ncbi:MAG: helix-turn-helix domain-containing protein [Propionibacteriales bacterium]|nr:helix-turn-helix domain-containing protein [Propionibacteriales bacterium]